MVTKPYYSLVYSLRVEDGPMLWKRVDYLVNIYEEYDKSNREQHSLLIDIFPLEQDKFKEWKVMVEKVKDSFLEIFCSFELTTNDYPKLLTYVAPDFFGPMIQNVFGFLCKGMVKFTNNPKYPVDTKRVFERIWHELKFFLTLPEEEDEEW